MTVTLDLSFAGLAHLGLGAGASGSIDFVRRRRRHSTIHTGGTTPTAISSGARAKVSTPGPSKILSSPGPPRVIAATVSSQVHNGNAATRDDVVQCMAAHTRAALTKPLMNALIGNGIDPI